jgi:hypothetical protein
MNLRSILALPSDDHTTSVQSDPGAEGQLRGENGRSLAVLIALVQEALETADAIELPLVGIDLCTALEKLRALRDPGGLSGV